MDITTVRKCVDDHLDSLQMWENLTNWCVTNFGVPTLKSGKWDYKVDFDYMEFYFVDAVDAELFILKWM